MIFEIKTEKNEAINGRHSVRIDEILILHSVNIRTIEMRNEAA